MENNENIKVEETTTTEEVENKQENANIKTFTQEDVDRIVAKEKARAKKNSISEEDMKAFREWQESKKTESEKQAEREKAYQKTESERDYLSKENFLLKKGVKEDDTDYIIYKLSKMEGEFEDNVKDFLQNNPRFIEKETVVKSTGVQAKNTSVETESGVRAILKAKHPEYFE